jgi:hypothetical protein
VQVNALFEFLFRYSSTRIIEGKAMSFTKRFAGKMKIILAVSALLSVNIISPADASTRGLFGNADPTYDGVFRHSIAVLGLVAAGAEVPASAISWLETQQCPNGGFEAFRSNPASSCAASNPETWSGIDTNSTALGAMALAAVGKTKAAIKAVRWIKTTQQKSGGVPYFKGGTVDASSSSLALMAAKSVGLNQTYFSINNRNVVSYLRTVLSDCSAEPQNRGALAYSKTPNLFASPMTSSQGLAAISGALATPTRGIIQPRRMACPSAKPTTLSGIRDSVAAYVKSALTANAGVMPSEYGSGNDWGSTAWAVIGLAGAGFNPNSYGKAITSLENNVASALAISQNRVNPGRAGLLILAAVAAGENPRSFGGRNLINDLRNTLTQ